MAAIFFKPVPEGNGVCFAWRSVEGCGILTLRGGAGQRAALRNSGNSQLLHGLRFDHFPYCIDNSLFAAYSTMCVFD
jgi:hypothetical protein